MNRRDLVAGVSRALGDRQLVFIGTRADDIETAIELHQLAAAFSIIAGYRHRSSVESIAIEDFSGNRVDLDAYDLDEEPDAAAFAEFRRQVLNVLSRPSAVFTYRPSVFTSAVCFARRDGCEYLGMFKDHQSAFEHKPWVETAVAGLGLAHIPWSYVADEDQIDSLQGLRDGPMMLRRSRTSGGTGLVRVESAEELAAQWPQQTEAYVSVAPYIAGGVPVNVGAVVWHDGVTLHPPSVQLIGIPDLTNRPFGYCGNDFGAAADIEPSVIAAMDKATIAIGEWLGRHGYRGAFGVDFLVTEGKALFTEVNPRFQGSTHLSCQISADMDESCLLIDHLAAHLDFDAPPTLRLADYLPGAPMAHLVLHWLGEEATHLDPGPVIDRIASSTRVLRTDVQTRPELRTLPGATIARLTVPDRVPNSGFELIGSWSDLDLRVSARPGVLRGGPV